MSAVQSVTTLYKQSPKSGVFQHPHSDCDPSLGLFFVECSDRHHRPATRVAWRTSGSRCPDRSRSGCFTLCEEVLWGPSRREDCDPADHGGSSAGSPGIEDEF